MSRIFISHSVVNNAEAIAVRDWLVEQGWDDLFLDLDPERGLKAGQKWQDSLKRAAERCELVLFLVSPAWCKSKWCIAEFLLARNLNKRIFGVIVEPTPLEDIPTEMTSEWQLADLTAGIQDYETTVRLPPGDETATVTFAAEGLSRLRIGLNESGLDPRYFAWPPRNDPDRAPYRGLRPLEYDDAGIFFGREGPVITGLDMLRGLGEAAPPRLLVILGASGAGKSSFLRAGLLPRLARDDRHFLPLPIIRPETAVLTGETGLIASLEAVFKVHNIPQTRATIRTAVENDAESIRVLLKNLVEPSGPPDSESDISSNVPTIILSIDQGEELFTSDGAEEGRKFLDILQNLLNGDDPAIIVLFVIRSDAYEHLQLAKEIEGVQQRTLSLPPMPQGEYAEVIRGPARRLDGTPGALDIEDELVEAMLQEIEKGGAKDALPLLAFTLERLYVEHGGDGDLKLSEYMQLGGIKGSIEAAVENALKAADADPAIPKDRAARLALLRRGLIPWLAGIDPDTGAPRRRVARLSTIPEESRALVQHLVDQRLLATDVNHETGEVTIEPAHEALLRQWGLLEDWLEEDFENLATLEGVKRAARDWEANARKEAWLAHSDTRLDEAERVTARSEFGGFLSELDLIYLGACRILEQKRIRREQFLNSLVRVAAVVALILAGLAGWQWWEAKKQTEFASSQAGIAEQQREEAERQKKKATDQRDLAEQAAVEADGQRRLAEKAQSETKIERDKALLSQSKYLAYFARQNIDAGDAGTGMLLALEALPDENGNNSTQQERPYWPGAQVSLDHALQNNVERAVLKGHEKEVWSVAVSPDGKTIVSGSGDKAVRVWDLQSGTERAVLKGHERRVRSVAVSPDGKTIVSGSGDKTVRVWDLQSGTERAVLKGHDNSVESVAVSPDGKHIVSGSGDKTIRVWDFQSGTERAVLKGHEEWVRSVAVSPDGKTIVSGSSDKTVRVWDLQSGTERAVLKGHDNSVNSVAVFPDGKTIISGSLDKTIRVWDLQSGTEWAVLRGHEDSVNSVAMSPDGKTIVSGSGDKTVRVWDLQSGTERFGLRLYSEKAESVAVSPDSKHIVFSDSGETIGVWDLQSGTERAVLKVPTNSRVTNIAVSPDGKTIVFGSYDEPIRVWDLQSGTERAVLRGHEGYVESIAVTPDGKTIIAGSSDQTVRLWDMETGRERAVLKGHDNSVESVAVSPDGKTIVSGSGDGTIRVWDLQSGTERAVLKGHEKWVTSVAVSPDGKHIVSGSWDKTVRVWDLQSGTERAVLKGHEKWVLSVAVSPDGKHIVSGSDDDTIRVWGDLFQSTQALIDKAKETVPRCLTESQRRQFYLSPKIPEWCLSMNKWP